MAYLYDHIVDLMQQGIINQFYIIINVLVLLLFARRIVSGQHAQDATQELIIIRTIMQLIIGDIQTKPHLSQYKDLPQAHSRASGLLLAAGNLVREQMEYLLVPLRMGVNVLKGFQQCGQVCTGLDRYFNLFNRGTAKGYLSVGRVDPGDLTPSPSQNRT